MIIQLRGHVRWSLGKRGTIVVHNRLGETRTAFIESSAGREIWLRLAGGAGDPGPIAFDDLLSRLQESFGSDVPYDTLKDDLTRFLDRLESEHIVRVIDSS
jgi:hypothetical protein